MQRQLGRLDEELNKMKDRFTTTEGENILREMKVGEEYSPSKRSPTMSSGKVADIYTELTLVKETLTSASQQLRTKEKTIEALRSELGQRKEIDRRLAEKEYCLRKLKEELNHIKSSETDAINLLSEGMKRIQEMEMEIDKGKEEKAKVMDSLAAQTKQLEQTKILLEDSRLEIKFLRENMKRQENWSDRSGHDSSRQIVEDLKAELQWVKEDLARSREDEKDATLKVKNVLEENNRLKNELKSAMRAEENNKKAMDDLALALKEVAIQSNDVKEKMYSTEQQLETAQEKIERLKMELKETKEKYFEAKKESEGWKNTAERLRHEAEESLMAWNGKETGFVRCIKKAEEERDAAQQENARLLQAFKSGQNLLMKAKDENQKVRDILKQAINESNVAKEAAEIARGENSQLKDALAQKDAALNFLSQENEHLKINEAASFENIRELKRLLAEATVNDVKTKNKESSDSMEKEHIDEKEQGGNKDDKKQEMVMKSSDSMEKVHIDGKEDQGKSRDDKEQGTKKLKPQNSMSKENGRKLSNAFSFNLREIKVPHLKIKEGEDQEHKQIDELDESSSDNSDPLKGSIFDVAETPDSVTAANHQRKKSFTLEDGEGLEFDHLDESESDRSSRKKKALLRRFGDLIRRKGAGSN